MDKGVCILKTYYRFTTKGDYNKIIELNLRKSDKMQLKAATGLEPKDAIKKSVESSDLTRTVIHNEKVEGVFGLKILPTPSQLTVGSPWFLATDKFNEFSISFAKNSIVVVYENMLHYAPILMNFVDSRHKESIRWLKWIGFTVDTDSPVKLNDPDVLFYRF